MNKTVAYQKIVETAEKRFDYYGYKKTTVDEIASDAGISKGAVYLHFKNKEDILLEIMRIFAHSLLTEWKKISENKVEAPVKLNDMDCCWIESVLKKRNDMLRESLPTDAFTPETKQRFLGELFPQMKEILTKTIKSGIKEKTIRKDIDADKLSETILSQIRYSIFTAASNPDHDWHDSWRTLWELLCRGVCR